MTASTIETDYLVIGAGATAMAFVDTLLSETNARILIVDRNHRPGGHWNQAYSFVRLHQPSAFYGVNSRELSSWTKDQAGLNAGSYGLASGAELLNYFDQVMQQHFLPSGRVRYFPMCEYSSAAGETHHVITSLINGDRHHVTVTKKVVNATHGQPAVPSTHPPKYEVAADVRCVPVNRLPDLRRPHANYTVVGSGKTGIDACLWLLENGVDPQRIRWIMPRDAWLLDRANSQPGAENFETYIAGTIGQFEAIAEAQSLRDLYARLEARGQLVRIDKSVEPSVYRCGIVSQSELTQLRRIADIVRLGRVRRVERNQIVLDRGSLPADPDTLYIDCSACGLGFGANATVAPTLRVFEGNTINLLMLRWCQPLFSASVIAYVESHFHDDAQMNALCSVVPSPERPSSWLSMWAVTIANIRQWGRNREMSVWLSRCRLNHVTAMLRGADADAPDKVALLRMTVLKAGAAARKMPALLARIGEEEAQQTSERTP
jgi:hypothetical protein